MKKSDEGNFLEVDVQYLEKLHELHNNLSFLPERMKIEKVEKLVANILRNKIEYVIHIRNLKQASNQGLILKNVHKVIKFYQDAWLKPYIVVNVDLRKKAKSDLDKNKFKLMNNAAFGKTMQNKRKHRDIAYLGLSILELSKILMYEFSYDYIKPKHGEKMKWCYMDTGIV